ncbi:hypothetical protein FOXG_17304 [Fusarium oxysporum f. sp. lycopersici 4287]|uniref:Uncharacterized protein n=2 Tax=Fusarium oxysporum TaxID=5507 RepID=A0A0J9WC06_FUSO4|nr:uncharacterized protein FOXG_17304 [Fusarium oxysporum f. sp. lycopersici 4287]KAJ9414791.1 hypothetical protein QL093DRAFT_2087883 [Fusarium oxysporum]KNB20070.1 hypothetical protein FOXG_17304 [Fusarium oxysporum f. sp. lycopersici 4287]
MHKNLVPLAVLGVLIKASLIPLQERATASTLASAVLAAAPSQAGQTGSPADTHLDGIQDRSVVSLYDRAGYSGQVPFNDFPEDVERLPKLSTTTSPAGSCCLLTATATTCHYVGVGHGSVCVENPTCLTWVPISASPLDKGFIADEKEITPEDPREL